MARLMERILSGFPPYRLYRGYRNRRKNAVKYREWVVNGKPVPPPHIVKQLAIREYSDRFRLGSLVETGTYRGEMIEAVRKVFDRIVSVELDAELCREARRKFRGFPHIAILQGDSGTVLKDVLAKLDRPTLFWLDGHYSGGETARGELDTPVEKELQHIFLLSAMDHVILIDDAREFTGRGDYPDQDRLRNLVRRHRPGWIFEARDDIIRIHPPAGETL
jgi:hypothetical protein